MTDSLKKEIFDIFIDLIKSDDDVELEWVGRTTRLRFAPKEFDSIEKVGDGTWSGTNYIILLSLIHI